MDFSRRHTALWGIVLLAALSAAACGCAASTASAPVQMPSAAVSTSSLTPSPQATAQTPFPTPVVGGRTLSMRDATLTLEGADAAVLSELHAALNVLPKLRTVELTGFTLGNSVMDALLSDYPAVNFRWQPLLCGVRFDSTSEEIDLTGTPIAAPEEISGAIGYFPRLKKLIVSDCGLTNEQLDTLNHAYPDTEIVWTVYFNKHRGGLRTDATAFSTKNGSKKFGNDAPRLRDTDTSGLRYCTDLVALDLGHNFISDISFLAGLKNLQILILSDNRISNISVLSNLQELVYVELFMNEITDVTPLTRLPKLLDLNLCHNHSLADATPLAACKSLQRLWIGLCGLPEEQLAMLSAALPETQLGIALRHSTAGGWREHIRYDWMYGFFFPTQPTTSPVPVPLVTPLPTPTRKP